MRFGADAERFLAPGCERIVTLAGLLAARKLPYTVIRTATARHIVLRLGREAPKLALAAHYDRVAGSPGVLDNSCACLQLVEFAARRSATGADSLPPLLLLFTDGEENPATQGATGQGVYALAKALAASPALAPGASLPPVLVLDVTGRGDRVILSSAPLSLLRRHGLEGGALAEGHERLRKLAASALRRAGLPAGATVDLPWSDDLGLILGGIPALTLSLLPEAELRELPERRPRTWGFLHGPDDGPELAEDRSFALISAFLDSLVEEIPEFGRPIR